MNNPVYSESVFVALGIKHVMRMRRIILTILACSAVIYFSTLSHKQREILNKSY